MATHAPSMGARTRAPSVNTPTLSQFESPGALLRAIDQACRQQNIGEIRFGRLAMGDGRLVSELRNGRVLRPATYRKVCALIATLNGEGSYKHERRAVSDGPRRQPVYSLTSSDLEHRRAMRRGSAALLAAILSAREA